MADSAEAYTTLREELRAFVREREWAQFHNPKDLALALNVEAGELLETFLWKPEADPGRVRAETADVVLYALLLADRLNFDLLEACRDKLRENAGKYPVEKARGRAEKYHEL